MRKVGGHDQDGFCQREEQDRDHHIRDLPEEFSSGAGDHVHREKRGNRRENRDQHRRADFQSALHRCLESWFALLLMRVDVLAHHNRIIHNQAQHEDERE